ncbi:MAG: protoporphyrinogen oxidase [Vicinamibacteria bacterium]
MTHTSVVVVGGGIAGLAAAHTLAKRSIPFLLLEKNARLGGTIWTERANGFLLDAGPDAFLAQKPEAVTLCRELGLSDRLIPTNPTARAVSVLDRGRLHPLPEGMVLTVPTGILPLARSTLFSPLGKLRMAMEPFVPARADESDESITSFVSRRLGREALERLAEPLLAGIHSGDPDRLSMNALFPRFVQLEKNHGSLVRGMRKARRSSGEPASIFLSLRGGLSELVEALVDRLPAGSIRRGDAVERVQRRKTGYGLQLASGEEVSASACVLAAPLRVNERLLHDLSADLATSLARIRTVSTAVVFLGFPRDQMPHALEGYGFVVPRTAGRRILAATFVSSKFAGRAPDAHVLLRVFLGGSRDPEVLQLSDADLVGLARDELTVILGPFGGHNLARAYRWEHATPQIEVGHADLLASIEVRLRDFPGLELAGNGLRGVGIPDCIADGSRAALAVAEILEAQAVTHRPL